MRTIALAAGLALAIGCAPPIRTVSVNQRTGEFTLCGPSRIDQHAFDQRADGMCYSEHAEQLGCGSHVAGAVALPIGYGVYAAPITRRCCAYRCTVIDEYADD